MQLKSIVNTALVGAGGISSELIDALKRVILYARKMQYWPSETLRLARETIEQFEPLLAEHIADSVLASWVYGFDDVAGQFPPWLQREFQTTIRRGPPPPPAPPTLYGMFDREPELKLPIIENAMQRLMERNIMTRRDFDAANSSAKQQAFEIAGGLKEDTIERMRGFLIDDMREGTSLSSFRNRVEEHLGTSPIAPGHLENVYRTNIQAAIRDGRETLRQNPIVKNTFPYQAYIAVHDARTRHDHKALEKLGLNGTNIYRADDPFWDHYTPPWDYNCRCSTRLLTIEQAAKAGVKEAKEWLRTGRAPLQPEYRLAAIPFEPNPDWGSRGKVGFVMMSLIRMSQYRAPKGYNKANPLMINGKGYVGGEFIPPDEYQKASDEQKKEIKEGKKFEPGSTVDLSKLKLSDEQRGVLVSLGKDGRSFPSGQDIMMTGTRRRAVQSLIDKGLIQRTEADGLITYKKAVASASPMGEKARVFEKVAPRPAPAQPASKPPTIPKASKPKTRRRTNEGNWRYTSRDFFKSGAKAKFRDNVEAIRTLKTLQLENRQATKEEQEKLSKYVGWGAYPQLFGYWSRDWAKEQEELRSLLSDAEYADARASTTNAHFTHPDVVAANWQMAERLGFKGGRFLEPAVGAGYYVGLMPEHLAKETTVTAVEMDQLTGNMAKQLYPSANVQVSPFQDYQTPDDFYDIVSTNVPFSGKVRVFDPKYRGKRPLIHDYYFMRSVDTAKPGGLIMHLTSAGTLDKLDPNVRKYVMERAELVSAVRFPGDTHLKNAGTSVVTDMLILRKKHPGIPEATDDTPEEAKPKAEGFTGTTVDALGRLYHWRDGKRVPAPKWDDVVTVPDPAGGEPIVVNRYFAENPEQVLGTLDRTGSMYGGGEMNVTKTDDYEQRLQGAIDRLPEGAFWADKNVKAERPEPQRIEADQKYAEGQLVSKDGQIYQHFGGALTPVQVSAAMRDRILGQMAIRDSARRLIAAQQTGEGIDEARAALNKAYDDFTAKYGVIHDKTNRNAMKMDPDGKFLLSLESYNSTTKQASKADIFSKDTINRGFKAEKANGVVDATGIVLNETGTLDVDRIAELVGKSREEIEDDLIENGLAFRDPNGGKWTHAAEYLSGNVRKKLNEARTAAASDPQYDINVKALEANQPEDIPPDDIGVKLGAPWVPPAVIKQFAAEVLGASEDDFAVRYAENIGEWFANYTNDYVASRRSNVEVWGVQDDSGYNAASFMEILNSALSGKAIVIRSATSDDDGNRPVLPDATEKAREKVEEMKARFKEWVWEDDSRAAELHRFYNDNYNNIVPTHFDGSHLTFPGMASTWPGSDAPLKLRDMQKNFIWRVITTGKGLAAHEVGTGKTASMIASAMELRRLGLAKKPCIAVLKSNIEQITAEAQQLYPGAKILSTADMFNADKRQQTLNQIATGDYDMIIMTHDHLDAMKMKPETSAKFIQEEIEELSQAILAAEQEQIARGEKKQSNRIVKRLENQKQKLEEDLKKALADHKKDDIFFEDSGIDMLMVDEAHKFKSLPCHSRQGDIKGIPSGRSERATNMLMRTRWLLDKNKGRGVVFATGTPIANTMGELFNMQRYLQYDALKERGLHRFDAWKDTFGDTVTRMEFKLNGDVAPTTRFAEFVNLPELRHLASEFMDVQLVDDQVLPDGKPVIKRPNRHDHVVISPENDAIKEMMAGIHARAAEMKNRRGPPEKGADNMLNVCNDAKLGSIDMRLLDRSADDHPDSKVNQCVRKVMDIYNQHPGQTQCIFSDLGVHDDKKKSTEGGIDIADSGFSVFKDIRRKLVAAGIPDSQIVDFSDSAMSDVKRQEAQEAAKRGDVRIMLGSTMRLGTGTNVQHRLKAIHHLDIPYVPAFLEQRDGRGYRSGNKNSDIDIYKYVQQGSADNLFWQIVANKSNFINQYMRGRGARTMQDLDTESLSPEEMVAVSTGDESMLERVALEDEVKRLRRAQSRHKSDRLRIQSVLENSDKLLAALETKKRDFERDASHLAQREEFDMRLRGSDFSERSAAHAALVEAVEQAKAEHAINGRWSDPIHIGSYRGLPVHVKRDGMLELHGPSGQAYESGSSLQSIEHAARKIGKLPASAEQKIKDFHTDLAKMRQQHASPFRHEQTLLEKETRLQELKNKQSQRMSLTPGVTKVINGVTYTLNQHHRWANENQQQSPQPQQPTQQPQQAAQPQTAQPSNQPVQPAQSQPQAQPEPNPQSPPSPETIRLAAQVGDSPQHRAARTHVAKHYLTQMAKSYDHKTKSMVPLSPAKVEGMFDGIDLSKPVVIGPPPEIPPPDSMVQWQANGGYRGSYFSVPGTKPQDLGIYDHATAWTVSGTPVLPREQTVYETRTAKFNRMSYLFSTAAPTIDTWSVPGTPKHVSGGGPQWYIPTAAHPNVRIAKKHGPPTSNRQNGAASQAVPRSGNGGSPPTTKAS